MYGAISKLGIVARRPYDGPDQWGGLRMSSEERTRESGKSSADSHLTSHIAKHQWPSPLAGLYHKYRSADRKGLEYGYALLFVEGLFRFANIILLADIAHRDIINRDIRQSFNALTSPSMGKLLGNAKTVAAELKKHSQPPFSPDLVELVLSNSWADFREFFPPERNDYAHRIGAFDDKQGRKQLEKWRPHINKLIASFTWLAELELGVFVGNRLDRRHNEFVAWWKRSRGQIDDDEGVEVRGESSFLCDKVLLLNANRTHALPLSPLIIRCSDEGAHQYYWIDNVSERNGENKITENADPYYRHPVVVNRTITKEPIRLDQNDEPVSFTTYRDEERQHHHKMAELKLSERSRIDLDSSCFPDDFDHGYEELGPLGTGAFAIVYEVRVPPDLPRALKVLRPELTGDRKIKERFKREARALSSLKHKGLVQAYRLGETKDGNPYIEMELIKGKTIKDAVAVEEDGSFNPTRAVALTKQLLEALCYIHENSWHHRDIKPSNVMLMEDDRLKLIDFGIADETRSALTSVGTVTAIGTELYRPPGNHKDRWHLADIYGAGLLLAYMLGFKPTEEQTAPELGRLPESWEWLQGIYEKATAFNPEERYFTAKAMLEDLQQQDLSSEEGDWYHLDLIQDRFNKKWRELNFQEVPNQQHGGTLGIYFPVENDSGDNFDEVFFWYSRRLVHIESPRELCDKHGIPEEVHANFIHELKKAMPDAADTLDDRLNNTGSLTLELAAMDHEELNHVLQVVTDFMVSVGGMSSHAPPLADKTLNSLKAWVADGYVYENDERKLVQQALAPDLEGRQYSNWNRAQLWFQGRVLVFRPKEDRMIPWPTGNDDPTLSEHLFVSTGREIDLTSMAFRTSLIGLTAPISDEIDWYLEASAETYIRLTQEQAKQLINSSWELNKERLGNGLLDGTYFNEAYDADPVVGLSLLWQLSEDDPATARNLADRYEEGRGVGQNTAIAEGFRKQLAYIKDVYEAAKEQMAETEKRLHRAFALNEIVDTPLWASEGLARKLFALWTSRFHLVEGPVHASTALQSKPGKPGKPKPSIGSALYWSPDGLFVPTMHTVAKFAKKKLPYRADTNEYRKYVLRENGSCSFDPGSFARNFEKGFSDFVHIICKNGGQPHPDSLSSGALTANDCLQSLCWLTELIHKDSGGRYKAATIPIEIEQRVRRLTDVPFPRGKAEQPFFTVEENVSVGGTPIARVFSNFHGVGLALRLGEESFLAVDFSIVETELNLENSTFPPLSLWQDSGIDPARGVHQLENDLGQFLHARFIGVRPEMDTAEDVVWFRLGPQGKVIERVTENTIQDEWRRLVTNTVIVERHRYEWEEHLIEQLDHVPELYQQDADDLTADEQAALYAVINDFFGAELHGYVPVWGLFTAENAVVAATDDSDKAMELHGLFSKAKTTLEELIKEYPPVLVYTDNRRFPMMDLHETPCQFVREYFDAIKEIPLYSAPILRQRHLLNGTEWLSHALPQELFMELMPISESPYSDDEIPF